jgi:hypothetical protein
VEQHELTQRCELAGQEVLAELRQAVRRRRQHRRRRRVPQREVDVAGVALALFGLAMNVMLMPSCGGDLLRPVL